MIHTTPALVLGSRKFSESSRIVTLFSRDLGKIGVVARGVAQPRSRLAGVVQPMSCITAVIYVKEGRDLQNLSTAETLQRFPALQSNLESMTSGLAIVEIVNAVTIDADPNVRLFDLVVRALGLLGTSAEGDRSVRVWFMAQLADALGYALRTGDCGVCGETIDRNGSSVWYSAAAGAPVCSEHRGIAAAQPMAMVALSALAGYAVPWNPDTPPNVETPLVLGQLEDLLHRFLRHHVEGMRALRVGSVALRVLED